MSEESWKDFNEQSAADRRMRKSHPLLIAALQECADDLEADIKDRYESLLNYPSQVVKFDRDMKPVLAARAALKAAGAE